MYFSWEKKKLVFFFSRFFPLRKKKHDFRIWMNEWQTNFSGEIQKYDTFAWGNITLLLSCKKYYRWNTKINWNHTWKKSCFEIVDAEDIIILYCRDISFAGVLIVYLRGFFLSYQIAETSS